MAKPALRDADRSREAILDSAEELFSRLGYEGVSLADIAQLARVSRGLPSYFFADKQGLYAKVMERAAARNRRAVLDVIRSMKGSDPPQILQTLIERYIDYLAANPRVVQLLQWESLEAAHKGSGAASGIPQRVFVEAASLISQRIRTAKVAGFDVADLLLSIVSLCLYPFQVMPVRETRAPSFLQKHKRHVSLIVLRAIGEKA